MSDLAQHLATRRRVPVIRDSRAPVAKAATIAGPEWTQTKAAASRADARVWDVERFVTAAATRADAWQAAIDSANAAGGGIVTTSQPGTHTLTKGLVRKAGVTLRGLGPDATTLDFSTATTFTANSCIYAGGTLTALPALTLPIPKDSRTVTFASNPGLVAGDRFCLYDSADGSFNNNRTYYRKGEWCVVASVSGTTVTLHGRTFDSYDGATVSAHKMTPVTGDVADMTVIGKPATWGYTAELAAGGSITNVRILRAEAGLIQLFKCMDMTVTRVTGNHLMAGAVGSNYGVMVGNSQNVVIDDCTLRAQWHAVSHGGGSGVGCVPTRRVITANSHLSTAGNISAWDAHGNTEHATVENCTIDGGCSIAGDHITVRGNRISTGAGPIPIQTGDEILGGNIVIEDNDIYAQANHNAGLAFVQVWLRAALTRPGGTFRVKGNRFHLGGYTAASGTTAGLLIYQMDSPVNDLSLEIDDNTFHSTLVPGVGGVWDIYLRCGSGRAFRRVLVRRNTLGAGGIRGFDLNARRIVVEGNTGSDGADLGIYLDDNPAPVYTAPHIRIARNALSDYQGQICRVDGLAGTIVELDGNTFLRGNGVGSTNASLGAAVLISTAARLYARNNLWGDDRATTKNTHCLYALTVTEVIDTENEKLGTVLTDVMNGVTYRHYTGRGLNTPEGAVTASPGSTYRALGTGNLYVKRTGTLTNTGWQAVTTA